MILYIIWLIVIFAIGYNLGKMSFVYILLHCTEEKLYKLFKNIMEIRHKEK